MKGLNPKPYSEFRLLKNHTTENIETNLQEDQRGSSALLQQPLPSHSNMLKFTKTLPWRQITQGLNLAPWPQQNAD